MTKPLGETILSQFRWKESDSAVAWPKRLFVLDFSRGIAAFAVVVWHWQHFYFLKQGLPRSFRWSQEPWFDLLKLPYQRGLLAVDYFFLLSGFIFFWLCRDAISARRVDAPTFAFQRFSRLYPLHLLTLLLVLGLQSLHADWFGHPFVYGNLDPRHLLLNLGFVQSWGFEVGASFNGPAWSISVEFFLYVVFFLLAFWKLAMPGTCVVLSVVAFAGSFHCDAPLLRGIASFFLGGVVHAVLGHLLRTPRARWRWIHAATIACWVAVLVNFHVHGFSRSIAAGWRPLGKVFLTAYPVYVLFPLTLCSLVLFEIRIGRMFERVAWFGNLTYSSYLLHFPLQILFMLAIGAGILPRDAYGSAGWLLLFLAVLVVLSHFTYVWFERPVQDWLRTALGRGKARIRERGTPTVDAVELEGAEAIE